MIRRMKKARRALTVLELLLALMVTGLVGLGIASMLTMVSSSASADQDRRSVILRSHAAQVRLRSYVVPALCILQHDPNEGIAIWLHDERPRDNVNLTELRVIWWREAEQRLVVERVVFPDGWTDLMKEMADHPLPAGTNYFNAMTAQRGLGHTHSETLIDQLEGFEVIFNEASPSDATRIRFELTLRTDGGDTHESLLAMGMPNHRLPEH
ncbi:MAG: hypothetical protein EA376_14360 [Phycisphaeraceae bacterium]|nr:MAG: hypothetical protein EA376_14360 [Phycisphaeraceae bacterium]